MSSLFKRSKWTLQYVDDRRSPSKKQFSLRTTSKRTATRLKAELDDLYQRGLFDPWTDDFREALERVKRPNKPSASVKLSEAREQFLEAKEGLADSSQRMYDLVTRLFMEEVGEAVRLSDVTARHVTRFLTNGNLSLTSRHTYLRHLKVFVRWCAARGWMKKDVTHRVSLRRKPDKKLKAFTLEEVGELVEAAVGYVRSLIVLGAYTGLRRSELSRLRWEEVDLEVGEILVTGPTKSGKDRVVPLASRPASCLDEMTARDGYVLNLGSSRRPVHPDTLTHDFLELRREVYPKKTGHSLHSLRHSYCTWLAEAGTPVHVIKQLAGHASIETTMQYVHNLSGGHKHVARAFG